MNGDTLKIQGLSGEKKLKGEIVIGGAKNAVLPLMAASFLFSDEFVLENVPDIEDVKRMCELLAELGVTTKKLGDHEYSIDTASATGTALESEISKKFRASIILSGPLLARFGKVSFPHPGGCVIGARPIDVFIEGFEKMGGEISTDGKNYIVTAKNGKLSGTEIFFKLPSVTATETFIMAGVLAEGKTVLRNVAMEPEIEDLANYLNSCGAKITGAGTPTIEIEGIGMLVTSGKKYVTMPDRIEAGSFLILGSLCAEDLLIKKCEPKHLDALTVELVRAGVPIEIGADYFHIKGNLAPNSSFKSFNIKTHEYPGFPTDIQAPASIFLTQSSGDAEVFETIFENRLNYANDLVSMGADIKLWGAHTMTIKGPAILKGKELYGPDIRAGLALVIAALVAKGESLIHNVYYIDRGYENIEGKLRSIGAGIERLQ